MASGPAKEVGSLLDVVISPAVPEPEIRAEHAVIRTMQVVNNIKHISMVNL